MQKYRLSKEEYQETIWYIRRYPEFKERYNDMLLASKSSDGQPRGSGIGDPTATLAIKTAAVHSRMKPIENSLTKIPEEYRNAILENIINRKPYPSYADTSTWKRWKRRFVFYVAIERRKNEGL